MTDFCCGTWGQMTISLWKYLLKKLNKLWYILWYIASISVTVSSKLSSIAQCMPKMNTCNWDDIGKNGYAQQQQKLRFCKPVK